MLKELESDRFTDGGRNERQGGYRPSQVAEDVRGDSEGLSEDLWRRLRETSDAQRKDPQNKGKYSAFVEVMWEAGRSLGMRGLNSPSAWNRIIDRLDELRPDWRGYVPNYTGYAVIRRS